jgi:hypothetical protein
LLVGFAEALVKLQHEDGSFPGRVFTGNLKTDPVLDRTASSALPVWYLAEMLNRGLLPGNGKSAGRSAERRAIPANGSVARAAP